MYNFDSNNYVEYIILGTAGSVTAWTGIRFVKTKSKFSEHAKVFKTLSAAAQKVVGEFDGLMKNHQAVADVKSDFEPIEGLSNTIQSCMRFLHSKFGESLVKTSEKIGSIFVKSLDAR